MIGILIIAHGTLGDSLIHCASHVFGGPQPRLATVWGGGPGRPRSAVASGAGDDWGLDDGSGVLVLTDMYGATPSNIACRLVEPGRVECVAGVNLPMLVRAITYRNDPLEAVAEKRSPAATMVSSTFPRKPAMLQQDIEIVNKLGLHARASAKLTQMAGQFKSEIWIARNERRVNAKSIMGVMMLAANKGSTIHLEIDGADEGEAMQALAALIADRFGEGE